MEIQLHFLRYNPAGQQQIKVKQKKKLSSLKRNCVNLYVITSIFSNNTVQL